MLQKRGHAIINRETHAHARARIQCNNVNVTSDCAVNKSICCIHLLVYYIIEQNMGFIPYISFLLKHI